MKAHVQGLRVLLLPMPSDSDPWDLLLPAAAVVEIVRAEPLEVPGPADPDWLCGFLAWRGLRLPLVRPTTVTGPSAPTAGGRVGRTYAAVCFAPAGGEGAAPFFAIESPGMPRLERVTPDTLSADTGHRAADERLFTQVALRVLDRPAGLLDLDALQRALQATIG